MWKLLILAILIYCSRNVHNKQVNSYLSKTRQKKNIQYEYSEHRMDTKVITDYFLLL